jgi:hypothetical protein
MKNFRSLLPVAYFSLSAIFFFAACGSSEDVGDDNDSGGNSITTDGGKTAQNVFYSIPSPIELATLVQKAGATYDTKVLNDPMNVSKYSTSLAKALNLGVYGADLSVTTIFDQTQESVIYLKCSRRLADELGITGAFSDNTVQRMDNNKGNRDSLLNIISDSYFSTDEYLKENQRPGISALVLAGGWIEALYVGTQLAKSSKNNAGIIQRIADLKGSLENLVSLLELYKNQEGVNELLGHLKGLMEVYKDVQVNAGDKTSVQTDEKTNVTTIGGGSTVSMTQKQFEEVSLRAEKVRKWIVTL